MTRTQRFGSVAAAVLVVASLSACQAGQSAQTSQDYAPVDGRNVNLPADATFGDPYVAVRNAFVEAFSGTHSAVMTVVNNTDAADVLLSVDVAGEPATLSGGPVEVASRTSITIGSGGEATAVVRGLDVPTGSWTDVTVTFQNAGVAEIPVLVTAPVLP